MSSVEAGSVNLILADLPFGTTKCSWDTVLPFDKLWSHYERVLAPKGAVVLFATQPFTSALVMSKVEWFKYCWTWNKRTAKGHLVAKIRPLQQTEDIAVFGRDAINYYPLMRKRDKPIKGSEGSRTQIMGGKKRGRYSKIYTHMYPKTLLTFPWTQAGREIHHPTEKPVDLLQYLILTYTREGDLVLDNTMGSGSTMVAAALLKRDGIGIELYPLRDRPLDEVDNPDHFHTAQARVARVLHSKEA